jgi:heptosyltransferase-2
MKIIIRIPNWIGDAVMFIPALENLKKSFKNSEIHLIGRIPAIDIFKNYPGINTFLKIRGKGFINELKIVREIRKQKFDIGYLFPNSFISAFIFYLGNVKNRIGYNRDGRGFLLTEKVKPEFSYDYHFSDYYLNLLKLSGLEIEKKDKIELYISEEECEKAKLFLKTYKKQYKIGFASGASFGDSKKWFPERFRQVAEYFEKKYNAQIFYFGGSDDYPDCVKSSSDKSINLCGETNLRQAMGLIGEMNLFISNDSGLMHVANALGVPTIGIFGSTSPTSTYPYNKNRKIIFHRVYCSPCKKRVCPYKVKLCMDLIKTDEVIKAGEEFLSEK